MLILSVYICLVS